MEKAVLEGLIKQGAKVKGILYPDMLYIQAVKMVIDKSVLFGLLSNTDVHMGDIILRFCPYCGRDLTTNI